MNAILTLPFRLLAVLLLAVALSNQSPAKEEKISEVTTSTGKTYQDVRVTGVTPKEVSIMHESGMARIPIEEIPDDMKEKLGIIPQLEVRVDRVKKLYEELWEIRMNPEFLKVGFAGKIGQEWLSRVKLFEDDGKLTSDLSSKGIALGELQALGKEWFRSNGTHTDLSTRLVTNWDKVFGLKHEIVRATAKEKSDSPPEEPDDFFLGSWNMDGQFIDTIQISASGNDKYSIVYHFNNGKKLDITARRVGPYLKFDDNPSGDYVKVNSSGHLELRDKMGLVNTGKK
ncbi:MAG: hypothetical protein WCG52_10440 [bacterium]